QPLDRTPLNTHRQHTTGLAPRIVSESSRPFSKGIIRRKIGGGEHGNGAMSTPRGLVHLGDEVGPRPEIPGLDDGAIASLLQVHGNPLRPGTVVPSVTDKKILALLLALRLVVGHHRCPHRSCTDALLVHSA